MLKEVNTDWGFITANVKFRNLPLIGIMIKQLGIEAHKDIEEFLGKSVHLELYVKTLENRRDNENSLKKFGY